jgi:hypothetical protein
MELNMINVLPGCYRVPLACGLNAIGEDELGRKVRDRNIELSFVDSTDGTVDRDDLKQVFVKALKTGFVKNVAGADVIPAYLTALERGAAAIVEKI